LDDLLPYEQPGPYIVKSTNYDDKYDIPVLTPGKSFILGYINEKEGIYRVNNSKAIIFDDFTTASRLIDFNFKVKSSAMKILKSSDESKFNIDYLYFLLQTLYVNNDTHKRYWISEFAIKKVKVHTFDDQIKIVKTINDITNKLDYIIDSKI
jgi:type-1 restriction enzyme ecoR124II specificity protein